jgi:outer membrane protein OmpA-like peptidoglycan-associated protein
MKEDPSVRLLIEGHTDSTNTDAFNLDLSQRRSKAVVDWLTKHGVDPKRLEAKGFGRARPVADNASAQGRALNRRVEVSVLR